jgi:hypothetical protein
VCTLSARHATRSPRSPQCHEGVMRAGHWSRARVHVATSLLSPIFAPTDQRCVQIIISLSSVQSSVSHHQSQRRAGDPVAHSNVWARAWEGWIDDRQIASLPAPSNLSMCEECSLVLSRTALVRAFTPSGPPPSLHPDPQLSIHPDVISSCFLLKSSKAHRVVLAILSTTRVSARLLISISN